MAHRTLIPVRLARQETPSHTPYVYPPSSAGPVLRELVTDQRELILLLAPDNLRSMFQIILSIVEYLFMTPIYLLFRSCIGYNHYRASTCT